MSLMLSTELAAACNALGHYDAKNNIYHNEDNLVETVKDIIRYLRRDNNETHEIRRYFGTAKILQVSLVPLLKLYWEQSDLFDVLLRLTGNITSPVLLLYNEEVPKEKTLRNHFLQILGHLQSYKEAFADDDLWAVLCTKLSQLLSIECQERGSESGLIIERILILVRNVLSVPADIDDEKRADNDVSAHDKVLWSLRQSGLVDIIHYMVSSDQEETYSMYLLEILSLMLREHRPVDLALASGERTVTEKAQDDNEFERMRTRELGQRKERLRNYTSVRHSRFGGCYLFNNVKSVSDEQQLIYHKKLNTAKSLDFDIDKSTARVAKNRKPVRETSSHRRSTFSIRLLLKDFCIEFLNSGYNKLMHIVRGKLVRGQGMENDETYYLWALRFFMEFNRHYKFNVKLVSETMGHEIFHYIQQRMEHYYDMIFCNKTKWPLWSKRLHLAVQAYKELLFNVAAMDKSAESRIRDHSKVIKSNIFYVVEYREFIVQLLVAFDEKKMSDAYLLDLIETQHIFLKMLQAYCGKNNTIVVQKIQKVRSKKRQHTASAPVVSVEEALELKWDELAQQLSTVMEGGENIPVVVPFDAASEVPINDQRKNAMIKIQDYLRESEIENAIGLLRAARNEIIPSRLLPITECGCQLTALKVMREQKRDVWPDNDSFGSSSMTPEEEFLAIREIFFAKLRDKEEMPSAPPANEPDEDEDEEDEEDEGGAVAVEKEVDFKFQDFVNRFAQAKVIQACGLALKQFDTNSVHVNNCILKLLHRIAWDCKMPAMLFQASIFRTFQRIFQEDDRPEFKELVKFAIYIVRQFIKVSEKNKKVFMELLFWKSAKEAFDAEEGYGSFQTKSDAMKKIWTEEEENELRVLVMEHKEKGIQENAVDWLMNNLVDNTKTSRQIKRKLTELMLMDPNELKKKSSSSRPAKDWQETEIEQLTSLYNDFKDAMDPLSCIMDRLDVKRPKARVKQKILELGLADNKALRKKRATKSRGHQEEDDLLSRSNNDDELLDTATSSSDEENENSSNMLTTKTKATPRANAIKHANKKANKRSVVKNVKLGLPAIKKLVLQIIENDMTDSLKWISECLTEAAEDQEQEINLDGNEGIPLVPINAKDIQAIKNPVFEKFLLGIEIQKPASEQEKFWRIPGNILAAELKKQANLIDELVEKGSTAFPEYDDQPPASVEESSDEDVFDRIRKFVAKPTNEETVHVEEESANQNEPKNNDAIVEYDLENGVMSQISTIKLKKSKNTPAKKSKRITLLDDSDESDLENETENNMEKDSIDNELNVLNSNTKNKSKIIDLDESDSEMTQNKKIQKKSMKVHLLNDSDQSEAEKEDKVNDTNEMDKNIKSSAEKKFKRTQLLNDSDESNSENAEQNANKDVEKNKKISSKKKSKTIQLNESDDSTAENEKENKEVVNKNGMENYKKNSLKKKTKRVQLHDSSESDGEIADRNEKVEEMNVSATKKSKKILNTSDDSDSESVKENENHVSNDNEEEKNVSASKKSKRILVQSDDSDIEDHISKDSEEEINNLSKNSKNRKVLNVSDESDTSTDTGNVSKRTRESDSESNDHSKKRKKLSIIDSDDD